MVCGVSIAACSEVCIRNVWLIRSNLSTGYQSNWLECHTVSSSSELHTLRELTSVATVLRTIAGFDSCPATVRCSLSWMSGNAFVPHDVEKSAACCALALEVPLSTALDRRFGLRSTKKRGESYSSLGDSFVYRNLLKSEERRAFCVQYECLWCGL